MRKRTLKVLLDHPETHGFKPEQVTMAIEAGLGMWSQLLNIVQTSEPEIVITSGSLEWGKIHCCRSRLAGRTLTLHNGRFGTHAAQVFSSAERLASMVAHQIGHILGLSHSMDSGSVMHPGVGTVVSCWDLERAAQKIEGKKLNFCAQSCSIFHPNDLEKPVLLGVDD